VVRAVINAFGGRTRARKAVVQTVLSRSGGAPFYAAVAEFLARNSLEIITEEQGFVVSRAVMGAIRAAVLEERSFLKSRSFEDELVRLILSYLSAVGARS